MNARGFGMTWGNAAKFAAHMQRTDENLGAGDARGGLVRGEKQPGGGTSPGNPLLLLSSAGSAGAARRPILQRREDRLRFSAKARRPSRVSPSCQGRRLVCRSG